MAQSFVPGDDLIFQLESGYGLLRVLAVDGQGPQTVWHLLAYDDFYPNVEAAEQALTQPESLSVRRAHMALTDRAFERTPAALLGNRPVTEQELLPYRQWLGSEKQDVSDRSALLLLGIRGLFSAGPLFVQLDPDNTDLKEVRRRIRTIEIVDLLRSHSRILSALELFWNIDGQYRMVIRWMGEWGWRGRRFKLLEVAVTLVIRIKQYALWPREYRGTRIIPPERGASK